MQLKRIVTILDKPKHEQTAWQSALALQAVSGARIQAVSFLWNAMCEGSLGLGRNEQRSLRHTLVDERKVWLADLVAGQRGCSSRLVWTDDIAAWTNAEAERTMPDLVIKTVNHQRTMQPSSTDWALLERCPAPLLLVANRRRRTRRVVLAALDLRHKDAVHRHLNAKVLDAASGYARMRGAALHVVFAVEISHVLSDLDLVPADVAERRVVDRVRPELDHMLGRYDVPAAQVHLPVGKAGAMVAHTARKLKADLLVIGSRARRLANLVGLGNSAHRIVAKASCDVLTIHP